MFDYKLLEAFAKVVQEGGFEKAARRIHITQSATSQRVKQLEEQFGQILLLRTTPPTPTRAGKKVIKLYRQVRHLEDDLRLAVEPDSTAGFISVPVGINADSIDTWFFKAVQPFLDKENVLLDLLVDDQEKTHEFLRDGKALACISTRKTAIQGCRVAHIGHVSYGLYASDNFAAKWFPDGVTQASVTEAPGMCFTRDDELNIRLFKQIFGTVPATMPTHYVPSSAMFLSMLRNGTAYGMLPNDQAAPLARRGEVKNLTPDCRVKVDLYWHCWNLDSRLLNTLTKEVLNGFRQIHQS